MSGTPSNSHTPRGTLPRGRRNPTRTIRLSSVVVDHVTSPWVLSNRTSPPTHPFDPSPENTLRFVPEETPVTVLHPSLPSDMHVTPIPIRIPWSVVRLVNPLQKPLSVSGHFQKDLLSRVRCRVTGDLSLRPLVPPTPFPKPLPTEPPC